MPAKAMQDTLPKLQQRFIDTPYLEIGWGDKGFYSNQRNNHRLNTKSDVLVSGSVIHAVAVPENIEVISTHAKIEKLCLTDKAYASLIQFIADSFYRTSNVK